MAESDFYDPTYDWQKRIDGLQKKLTALQSRIEKLEAEINDVAEAIEHRKLENGDGNTR